MLDRGPGQRKLFPFLLGGRPAGDRPGRRAIELRSVPLLDQQTAGHRTHVKVKQPIARGLRGQDDHCLATCQHVMRFGEHFRRHDDVGHDLHDLLRGRAVERAVDRDDPTERRDFVALVRHPIGHRDVLGDRKPARVRVLDDRGGRLCVVHDQLEAGGGVLEVVESGRCTLHLPGAPDAAGIRAEPVERCLLMLVLAVLERLG